MKLIFNILLFNFLISAVFQTDIGKCELHLQAGDQNLEKKISSITLDITSKMTREFGAVQPSPFSIYLVASKDEFIRLTKGYAPEWSMAVAMAKDSRIILQSPAITHTSHSQFLNVVKHELNHLYLYRIRGYATFPSWFSEGLAMRQSGEFSILHKIRISQAKWRNELLPVSKIYSMRIQPAQKVSLAYGQSAAAVYAMEYYYGSSVFSLIFDEMNRGTHAGYTSRIDFNAAFQIVTGEDLLDFQEKYFRYIETNYNWLFLLKISNLIFISLPVILTAGYFFMRARNKKKLALWKVEEDLQDSLTDDDFDEEYPYN